MEQLLLFKNIFILKKMFINKNVLIYENVLIFMFMVMWMYIIFHKNFNINNINAEPLRILIDDNNEQYVMININNILDYELINVLKKELDNNNYFTNNQYIGINNIPNKEILLVIPYYYLNYITFDLMVTGVLHKVENNKSNYKLVPFKTIIKPKTINGTLMKNKEIILNNNNSITLYQLDNLYLIHIYNYDIDNISIPIYLLSNNNINNINNIDNIKVSMTIL